jgi:DNA modification methylase
MIEARTIGRSTLYLGDCREVLQMLVPADLVFTSPPYNCGKDYGSSSDDLPLADFKQFLRDTVFAAKARATVVNVGQYIGSRETRVLFRDVLLECASAPFFDEVIWDKGPANGAAWGNHPNSPRIRAQHESLYCFGDAKMPNGNGLSWADWSRLTTSIWRVPAQVDLQTHPAMMPVALAERAIQLWADECGTILDPFMGSGTTGIAAHNQRRDFIGIEQDPAHFETACNRIEQAQRQGNLFAEGAAA